MLELGVFERKRGGSGVVVLVLLCWVGRCRKRVQRKVDPWVGIVSSEDFLFRWEMAAYASDELVMEKESWG